MIFIHDNKRYNTETATEIAYWSNGVNTSDFKCCMETLYRTPKGAYFLFGEGGPSSKYSRQIGNGYHWGEEMQPLTEKQALAWCEKTNNVEAIEEHFKHLVEDA